MSGSVTLTVDRIRIPVSLIRAGMKFTSLMPHDAASHVEGALRQKGIDINLKNIKDEDIDRLRSINMKLLDDMSNSARFPYSNMEFHVGISEISRNPLAKLLVTALLQTLIMVYPSSPQSPKFIEATYERHCKILEAMGIRDVSLCMACLHEDVEVTRNLMV